MKVLSGTGVPDEDWRMRINSFMRKKDFLPQSALIMGGAVGI
jgi:hypothetical protein